MNQINQTPINPKGFTNMDNIQGVFGTQVPNTFTRDVNNPTNMVSLDSPITPPIGVETPITPNYDINNY
jgi:hypothetical protein